MFALTCLKTIYEAWEDERLYTYNYIAAMWNKEVNSVIMYICMCAGCWQSSGIIVYKEKCSQCWYNYYTYFYAIDHPCTNQID